MVREHHVLEQQRLGRAGPGLFRRKLDVDHPANDVPQQLSIHAVIGDKAKRIGIHLIELGQIVNDDAGREQAGIELGIDAHQRAGRA